MSSYDFPPDLVKLKRDFLAADARCAELAERLPPAMDIIEGRAVFTDEQRAELQAARDEAGRLLMALTRHDWWADVDDLAEAKQALHAAARTAS